MTRAEYHHEIKSLMLKAEKAGNLNAWLREMCRKDIFFLGVYILGRQDLDHIIAEDGSVIYRDWLFDRCMEVQANPDGYIDIWARDYYKSTIITFLLTIQDILKNPEITICIYSYSSSMAKKFLNQIKGVLESNAKLIELFPDILHDDVTKTHWIDEEGERKKIVWSEEGIRVKRKSNAKEHTIEPSGLVVGQKTGGHFNLLVYDDVVTPDSVTSPDMIAKTTKQYEMSLNTGSTANTRIRIIGTRYHYADTYASIIEKGAAKLRMYPAIQDGKPVLYTAEQIAEKKRAMGSAVFASQMLCDPKQASTMGFKREWLKVWEGTNLGNLNIYIIVDPAAKKKRRADYTVMWVIGLGADQNYYIIDIIRDKYDLTGKTNTLFALVRAYTRDYKKPQVFYEQVSMQSDVEHIEYVMNQNNYRFSITPMGATSPKGQRIEALEPLFREGRIWIPPHCWHVNWKGEREDMLSSFVNDEYLSYPFGAHDDGLDSLSRIADSSTSTLMAFPDATQQMDYHRHLLESRGMKFVDAEDAIYEPI